MQDHSKSFRNMNSIYLRILFEYCLLSQPYYYSMVQFIQTQLIYTAILSLAQLHFNSNLNLIMKIYHQKQRSPSLTTSSVSSFMTPRKFPSKFLKGLNITISKVKDNGMMNTRDKTTPPKSSKSSHKILHFDTPHHKNLPSKKLYEHHLHYSRFQTLTPSRNKSLPAFTFNYQTSGFSAFSQPYNKIIDYTTAFKSTSFKNQTKFSPFSPSSNLSHKNTIQSPKQISPFTATHLSFQNPSKLQYSPTLHKKIQPISLESDPKVKECKMSQIYVVQTPKKQNSMRDGFALKNLRKRLTQNAPNDMPSTISSKGRFESDKKNDFQFSLMEQKQKSRQKMSRICFKDVKNVSSELKEQTTTRSKKEREDFFNLTPKESQELDLQVFELTESNGKQRNENERESPFWKGMTEKKVEEISEISLIKPVRRRLEMSGQGYKSEDLNESLIIQQLLSSLKGEKEKGGKEERILRMQLIRKCSKNMCLAREKETKGLFGVLMLESGEKFIEREESEGEGWMCVRKYWGCGDLVMIEPFEYTLEEIYEMKLVDERRIRELIKKFHRTLNVLKESERGRINLKKLKERIVYMHGEFRLIPIIEEP